MKDIINKEKNIEKSKMINVQQNINKMSKNIKKNNLHKLEKIKNKKKLNNLITIKSLKPKHVHQNKYKYTLSKNIILNLLSVFYESKKRKNMNIIISKNKANIKKSV